MNKIRILFVCSNNSSSSQMAEAFLNVLAGEYFEAYSAGISPDKLSLFTVQVMRRIGIDIAENKTKSFMDYYNSNQRFDYVIMLCDKQTTQLCPVFQNTNKTIHWNIPEPAVITGNNLKMLEDQRKLRDTIKMKVVLFIKETAANERLQSGSPETVKNHTLVYKAN